MLVNATSGSWGAYADNYNYNKMKEEMYENIIATMFRHFTTALVQ